MSERRIFYAHPASHEADDIDQRTSDLTVALQVRAGIGTLIKVTPGRDDYHQRFPLCGSWDAWTASVGSGHAYDGSPLFHGIIVPTMEVGKATAGIIEAALRAERPVLYWQPRERVFQPVNGVEQVDNNWKTGWMIKLDGSALA